MADNMKFDTVSYNISMKEAKKGFSITGRVDGWSINRFKENKDGSKIIFIPDTIDGEEICHVAVKKIPLDAVVVCSGRKFSLLDKMIKANTAVVYLEGNVQFGNDEEERILDFIKKNPSEVAKVLVSSDDPSLYLKFIDLAKPKNSVIEQMIEALNDKTELKALLLSKTDFKLEEINDEFDLKPEKFLKKDWNYRKERLVYQDDTVNEYISIRKYKGSNKNMVIPEEIDGIPVEEIWEEAFKDNLIIENAMIPESVKTIRSRAFQGCKNLESVTISGKKVELSQEVFSGCEKLNSFMANYSGLSFFLARPFEGCSALMDKDGFVILDDGKNKTLCDVQQPIRADELRIPEGVTKILKYSFGCDTRYGDFPLPKKLFIPDSVKVIEKDVFKFYSFEIHGSAGSTAEKYAIANGFMFVDDKQTKKNDDNSNSSDDFVIKKGVLKKYKGKGGNVIIPQEVTKIDTAAFFRKMNIVSITIPNTVKKIGQYSFCACENLEQVHLPECLEEIAQNAFDSCKKMTKIDLPNSLKIIGSGAFSYSGLIEVHIPASVERIERDAFYLCGSLKKATFEKGLKEIGEGAFSFCSSLDNIDLPESIERIGDHAFTDCASLKHFKANSEIENLPRVVNLSKLEQKS